MGPWGASLEQFENNPIIVPLPSPRLCNWNLTQATTSQENLRCSGLERGVRVDSDSGQLSGWWWRISARISFGRTQG